MICRKNNKITIKKLKEFAKEERESAKEYRKLGFISQSKDELRHSNFFKRKIEQLKRKKKKK